jgi:hypothetical protein
MVFYLYQYKIHIYIYVSNYRYPYYFSTLKAPIRASQFSIYRKSLGNYAPLPQEETTTTRQHIWEPKLFQYCVFSF